ncbi:hypothetical protein BOTCAL_0030g00460 [Botryotinia calthae]|uniref:MYND-type domain-containing protein n=1 Tax=Botryotinia calthae TaxID=38488 RepID=A0A4Y8DFT9_9HELO|nr:hypothetical protein BOTCAL_0030g00460 [Botryotinia calthae]
MSATTVPSPMTSQCAHCGAPAYMKCSGCSSPLGEETVTITYYCDKKCQSEHRGLHKSACKAHQTKKLLYRAGETLQEIFYRYREVMFDIRVVKIEDRNGTLYVDEDYPDAASRLQILHEFPDSLVQNVGDKHALLARNACSEAIIWMQEVTGYFLTGIAANIKEAGVTPKNAKRKVKQLLDTGKYDNSESPHSCFKVDLENGGGAYSLDLSSAQYGYYLPVTPWTQYFENRVSKINSLEKFGNAKSRLTAIMNGPVNPLSQLGHMNHGCSDAMKSGTVKWETETGMSISSFLKLPQEQFEQKQKDLCDFVADGLRSYQKRTLEQAEEASKKPGGTPKTSFTPQGDLMDSLFELMKHAM